MNEFYNATKTVEPMQKNVYEKTTELKEESEKLEIVQENYKKKVRYIHGRKRKC